MFIKLRCVLNSDSSKSRRALVTYSQRALQRQPDATERSLIEQAPNQSDALRYPTRRVEARQRSTRVGGPVASGLSHRDEARPQRQGWVAGEIADRQHLIAQRGYQ